MERAEHLLCQFLLCLGLLAIAWFGYALLQVKL